MGVDRIRARWLEGNLMSGMNDDGDNAAFLGGCKVFGISTLGKLTDVFDDDVWFVLNGGVLVFADCGDVSDQNELLGDCNGCTRKCSSTKLKSCLCENVGGKKGFALSSDGVGV